MSILFYIFHKFSYYPLSSGCDFSDKILGDLVHLMLMEYNSSRYDASVREGGVLH